MIQNLFTKISLFILLTFQSIYTFAQTPKFILQEDIKIEGVKSNEQISSLNVNQKNVSRIYFDGLARPIQQVQVKGSPNQKDIVQPVLYDNLGRSVKNLLPYVSNDVTGNYRSNVIAEQLSFYNNGNGDKIADDLSPFSQSAFDNSPLQRLMISGGVGNDYQPGSHAVTMTYRTNIAGETIRNWNAEGTAASTFAAGTLMATQTTDQQGVKTIVFKDKDGQAILKKQQLDETVDGLNVPYLETYYIYDDLGLLRFVVPPKAVALMNKTGNYNLSQAQVSNLIFKYAYDEKGRPVERTVPGSSVIYMIYDPLDRLVLVQDGNLRTSNKWNYIKYDSRGVAVIQGIYTNAVNVGRNSMQAYVNSINYSSNYYEQRNTISTTKYYTNVSFPTVDIEPLAYSYYDDYDLDGNGTADFNYVPQGLVGEAAPGGNTRGMLTAISKRTLGSDLSNLWLTSVFFYDKRGNAIQQLSNNQLNASINSTKTVVPDFTGKTLKVKKVQVTSTSSTTILSDFAYDHLDRLKSIDEKYNAGATLRIAAYEYNEIGQLVDKKLHSVNGGNSFLQSLDYRYTIAGQVKSINNSTLTVDDRNDETNDLFGMELVYDKNESNVSNIPYYDGRISAVKWKVNAPTVTTSNERLYLFNYDKQTRLKSASYADRSTGTTWGNTGAYDEKNITYDLNGNIVTLQRTALLSGSIVSTDNLNYNYDANRLMNITDGAGLNYSSQGFKNITGSSNSYVYDAYGNLKTDPKKGLEFSYNLINRTDRITITTALGRYISYTYNADGNVIRKRTFDNNALVKTTDYIDGAVYENNLLSYFSMPEGRVRNSSGTLTTEYMIKDQQGNVRVSFDVVNGGAVVRQENSYYPFGLIMPGSTTPSAANKQLYNGGSEWQNDFANLPDLYETHYRNYDPTLGRFVSVDPLAEASESLTSYQYAFNNPLMFNDPLGDLARDYAGRSGPGSGKHWSDGIYNSDWSLWDGSASYKEGIAQGFTDWGGNLYNNYSKGEKIIYNRTNNEYGYFTYGPGGVMHSYKEESTFLNRYINYSPGTLGTWHEASFPNANRGGDWDNSKFALDIGGGLYGAMETAVAPRNQWLGQNGKYYNQSWGGNQYTGSRSAALKAASRFKMAGTATLVVTTAIGGIETYNGYQKDGGRFGYNAQSAAAQTIGSIGGGAAGGILGAKAGAAIGVWFGGVGVIPGTVIGGLVGGYVGGNWGSSAGQGAVNLYHGK